MRKGKKVRWTRLNDGTYESVSGIFKLRPAGNHMGRKLWDLLQYKEVDTGVYGFRRVSTQIFSIAKGRAQEITDEHARQIILPLRATLEFHGEDAAQLRRIADAQGREPEEVLRDVVLAPLQAYLERHDPANLALQAAG